LRNNSNEEKLAAIQAALDTGASKAAMCRTFGVKRTTLYDALARRVAAQVTP
jgi:transposase-like protein